MSTLTNFIILHQSFTLCSILIPPHFLHMQKWLFKNLHLILCFYINILFNSLFIFATCILLLAYYRWLPWWLRWWSICINARDPGSIPGLERSPGEGNGNPLQDYCLENPMDRGAWQAIYSTWGCKESDTTERLRFHYYCLFLGLLFSWLSIILFTNSMDNVFT